MSWGAHSLRGVEEEVDDVVSAFGVVEVDEQTPVDEPSALLQRRQRRNSRLHLKNTFMTE